MIDDNKPNDNYMIIMINHYMMSHIIFGYYSKTNQ